VSEWEVVEEDEEVVGEEESVVGEDEELVEDGVEVVAGDSEVVGRPRGDPVLEYVYGLTNVRPPPGTWSWARLASEAVRYSNMAKIAREMGLVEDARRYARYATRYARLAFDACPRLRQGGCPLTDVLAMRCPFGLERRCRMFMKRREKKWRRWFRRKPKNRGNAGETW